MDDGDPQPPPWVVPITVGATATIPGVGPVGRADLVEWLWMRLGDEGLVAIDEGSVDVAEAVTAGIVPALLVIDSAAAPADRDWVADRGTGTIELALVDAHAAAAAIGALAAVGGIDVGSPRPAPPAPAPVPQAPLAVPGFGWVLPPPDRPPDQAAHGSPTPGDYRVIVDAGAGFGTGLHPTTQLCLRALADHARAGPIRRVLDVGAGSGILGIAAAVAGAGQLDAVEIDDRVHGAICRNAALNGVADRLRLVATLADLEALPGAVAPYDLVVANIVAPVLIEIAPWIERWLARPGGRIVLCGLREDDVGRVAARYRDLLGAEPRRLAADGWTCLTSRA